MTHVPIVFHPDYVPGNIRHFNRLGAVAQFALDHGHGRLTMPNQMDPALLIGLHEPAYLHAYLNGREPLASSSGIPWSPESLTSTLLMLGGQRSAVELAMTEGLAFNLACGFHHAHPGFGGGFCALNGLALVAHLFPNLKVAVLDCDEHGGDGTEEFCRLLPNLHQATVFGTRFGVRGGTRSLAVKVPTDQLRESDRDYLDAVDDAVRHIFDLTPDIVLYQAGMDVHIDDPKSTLRLSTATLAQRDRNVLRAFTKARVPVVVVLAGAYQPSHRVVHLYGSTLREARNALLDSTHGNGLPRPHASSRASGDAMTRTFE